MEFLYGVFERPQGLLVTLLVYLYGWQLQHLPLLRLQLLEVSA